jgi:hypothetical protein
VELTCDGSEVVVRFPPFRAERLVENAEDTFDDDKEHGRVPPRYGVSVLASTCLDGETIEQTVERLCSEASFGRRSKTIAVVTGIRLRSHGFDLQSDPTGPDPAHHLVGKDPFTALPDGDLLESLFDANRMKNPSWTKG